MKKKRKKREKEEEEEEEEEKKKRRKRARQRATGGKGAQHQFVEVARHEDKQPWESAIVEGRKLELATENSAPLSCASRVLHSFLLCWLVNSHYKRNTRTRTRSNTNPNGTEANAAGRSLRACVAPLISPGSTHAAGSRWDFR